MTSLRAQNLAKSYKTRKVVESVSLEVDQGSIVGLLGPNGAGKTTSFYMIVGLVPSDAGQIFLGGEDITGAAMHARAKKGIGYLPQEASIFRKLSVQDNIMAILQLRKDLNEQQREEKLDELLAEFHIEHIRLSLGMSLSGGERRRVEIARALANDPKFILLDEPFAGVDPISVIEIKSIIMQLKDRGLGVLITDHNVRETLDVCERAYIVDSGSIIADGDTDTILENPVVRQRYLGEHFKM
ncbi:lipopolysaccharide ABC transporter ATP-binding protein [Kangiella geojedonensis]|uniref:Lipopolysaccharide export system ATP-binding protein LptB n=2 Tax=Kangiella geojedonensis TaxID=914150 RepID=A0A0F6TRK7_9GAMM|nr:LPS export ABC transporter ATP-binding protein [Kangiella geojedonensis]AKE52682.1 lipopolysaccharide ABC transporter ATP-binding protein [Kangiella geojedonensis]